MSFDNLERMGSAVEYNGAYYDSWTEGVWAAYFDAAGIPFIHEPETFLLPEVKVELENFKITRRPELYTPDFFLPEQDAFFEVKNGNTDDGTSFKLSRLARLTGKAGLLANRKPRYATIFLMSPDPKVRSVEYRHYGLFAAYDFSVYRMLTHQGVGHPVLAQAVGSYAEQSAPLAKPLKDQSLRVASKERKAKLRDNATKL